MSIGLSLAVSTLPWADTGCGGVLGYWHEYLTFVVSVQGVATGLATLMWLLVASSSRPTRRRGGQPWLNSAVRQRGDRAVFGVVFLMLFAFSYSEQFVSGLFPVVGGGGHTAWRIAVIVVDAAVLGLVGLMKRAVTRADGDAPRLWGWWWTGVAILSPSMYFGSSRWSRFVSTC